MVGREGSEGSCRHRSCTSTDPGFARACSDEVKHRTAELTKFIEDREDQLLFYGFSIDEEIHRMTVLAVHPDAASVERHLDVGAEAFREFADLLEMEAIEVYGEPSRRVREQLDSKARDLGGEGSVTIGTMHAGCSRLADPTG